MNSGISSGHGGGGDDTPDSEKNGLYVSRVFFSFTYSETMGTRIFVVRQIGSDARGLA